MNIQDIDNFSVKGTNAQVSELAGMLEKVGIKCATYVVIADRIIDIEFTRETFDAWESEKPKYPLKTFTEAKAIIESINNETEKTMSNREYKKGDKVIITKAYDVNSKVGWICSIIGESSVDCFFASCPDGKNWYIGAPDVNFKHGETPAKPKRKRQADEVEIKHNGIAYTATGWGGHTIADVAELDNTALASIAETEQTIKEYKAEIATLRKGIRARNEQRKYHQRIMDGEITSNGFTTKRAK